VTSCFVGTTKIRNLDSNIGSFKVKLNKDDLKEIEDTVPISEVAGNRTTDAFVQCSWKFANTPIKT
jgi:diketogulonate reductase-like aldo/keto reductase